VDKTAALKLETLHLVSDDLKSDFERQLATAVADCRQRPGHGKARKVRLELKIIPHPDDADDVLITPVNTLTIPAREFDPKRARRTRKDQLQFDFGED